MCLWNDGWGDDICCSSGRWSSLMSRWRYSVDYGFPQHDVEGQRVIAMIEKLLFFCKDLAKRYPFIIEEGARKTWCGLSLCQVNSTPSSREANPRYPGLRPAAIATVKFWDLRSQPNQGLVPTGIQSAWPNQSLLQKGIRAWTNRDCSNAQRGAYPSWRCVGIVSSSTDYGLQSRRHSPLSRVT